MANNSYRLAVDSGADVDEVLLNSVHKDVCATERDAMQQYVNDKVIKLMCWNNYMHYIGEKDPSTLGIALPNATRWHKTKAGAATEWDIDYWDVESSTWKYIDHWTTVPDDVASWSNSDSTSSADQYAFLVFEKWSFGSTLNPMG